MATDYGITVTEFARRQGVTRATVYNWMAQTPNLQPLRIAGLCVLRPADQAKILSRPRKKIGRPRKSS